MANNPLAQAETWLLAARRQPMGTTPEIAPDANALVSVANYHGMAAWLYLHARNLLLNEDVRTRLADQIMREVAFAKNRAERARTLCDALTTMGIPSLVLKGAAYAETLYERTWHRTSGDLDLLVPAGALPSVKAWLHNNGWHEQLTTGEPQTSFQSSWTLASDVQPIAVTLDLHWAVSNTRWLSETMTFERLYAASEAVPSSPLRWLGSINALLHACAHRAMHLQTAPLHFPGSDRLSHERLIWLEDIRLLALSLSDDARTICTERARAYKLSAIVDDALRMAFETVGHTPPFGCAPALHFEPSRLVLRYGAAGTLLADLFATPSMTHKQRLLGAHLFPSSAYMRRRFEQHENVPIAALHAWRLLRGARKFIARSVPRNRRP